MKHAALLFFLFTTGLTAQSNCDFQKLLKEGIEAARKEHFELAFNKFNSARRCDPNKGELIDKEVEKLFAAINQKKKQAETEKRRATAERNTANQRAEVIRKLRDEAERKARTAIANEIALRTRLEPDAGKSFRLLEFAHRIDPRNDRVTERLLEVCYDISAVFHRALAGHTAAINHIEFSPDGKQLATASDDNTVALWESVTGRCIAMIPAHDAPVKSVAFSPDGQYLATASADKTLKIWGLADQRLMRTFDGLGNSFKSVESSSEDTSSVYRALKELLGNSFESVEYSSDGQRLVSVSGPIVFIWDVQTAKSLIQIFNPPFELSHITNYGDFPYLVTDGFSHAQFGKQNDDLLTISKYRGLQYRNLADGENASPEEQEPNDVIAISVSGNIRVTRRQVHWKGTADKTLSLDGVTIIKACCSSDDTWAALLLDNNTVEIWNLPLGKKKFTLSGFTAPITALAFNPDASELCTGGLDHIARIWQLHDEARSPAWFLNKEAAASIPVTSSLSGDYSKLIVCKGNDLEFWDVQAKQRLKTLGAQRELRSAMLSYDGTKALSYSDHKGLTVWDTENKTSRELNLRFSPIAGSFSPDGKKFLEGLRPYLIRDLPSGKSTDSLAGKQFINYACFSRDGSMIATVSDDSTAALWAGNPLKQTFRLQKHLAPVGIAVFSPDGKWLATGSADKTLKIWNTANGAEERGLSGFKSAVTSAAFSSSGNKVVAASSDNLITLWDWKLEIKPLRIQVPNPGLQYVAILPGEQKMAVVFSKGFDLWRLDPDSLLAEMNESVPSAALTPDILEEYDLEPYFQYAGILDTTGSPMPLIQKGSEEELFHYAIYFSQRADRVSAVNMKDKYRKSAVLLYEALENKAWLRPADFYRSRKKALFK